MDMMTISYGRRTLSIPKPKNLLEIIRPKEGSEIDIPVSLAGIFRHPLGQPPLEQSVMNSSRIAIIIPDKNRRCPVNDILTVLLGFIKNLKPVKITIIIAHAVHRLHSWKEMGLEESLLEEIEIQSHDSRRKKDIAKIGFLPLNFLGLYKPVWINKYVAEADLVIVLGSIFPHLMTGFSGGAKGIIPGIAGRQTLILNHLFMFHRNSRLGIIEGNKCREDLEKGAFLLKKVFLINAIYDVHKKVVGLVGGDVVLAHRQGVKLCRRLGEVDTKKADIVIASDGYPETITIFQTMKLIAPASKVVKPGGVIIMAGECPEGEGELTFLTRFLYGLMTKINLPRDVSIYLLSETRPARKIFSFLKWVPSLEKGISLALDKIGQGATISFLLEAGLLIPKSEDS